MSDTNNKNREIKAIPVQEKSATAKSRKLSAPSAKASRPIGQVKVSKQVAPKPKQTSAAATKKTPTAQNEPPLNENKKPTKSLPVASKQAKPQKRFSGKTNTWTKLRPFVSVGIAVAIVLVLGVVVFNYAMSHYFSPVDKNNQEVVDFEIKSGETLSAISKNLETKGLVRSGTIFKYYVDFTDMSTKIGQGTFQLSPSMSVDEIINAIKRATTDGVPARITLREGLLLKDTSLASGMARLLVDKGIIKNTESFLNETKTGAAYAEKYDFIQAVIDKNNSSTEKREYILEGYLFPETYEFYLASSPSTVINRLLAQFDKVFTDAYKTRAEELGMSIDEVVILASIIEKEAKTKDFKKVSAVFHKRLQTNMKLGSCATHQYFMPVAKLSYNSEELKVASPYNTYENMGLPIGPICNPGKAAIEAALYPDEDFMKEGYLYFCLGDPKTGETVFAKTLPEHKANIAKYEPLWREAEKNM